MERRQPGRARSPGHAQVEEEDSNDTQKVVESNRVQALERVHGADADHFVLLF